MPPAIAPILWGVAGLGVGLIGASLLGKQGPDYSSLQAQMNDMKNSQNDLTAIQNTLPPVPENPAAAAADPGEGAAAVANPEADDARAQMAAAAEEAARTYNPNSGLGITSNAYGTARSLGGA